MTMCVDDLILLDLIAGRLEPGVAAAVRLHLDACDRCRTLHADLDATWRLLAEGDVPPPERDFSAKILTNARSEHTSRFRWIQPLRAAAAIALAAGIGSFGAWATSSRTTATQPPAPSRTELVSLMGFDTLGGSTVISPLIDPPADSMAPEAEEVAP